MGWESSNVGVDMLNSIAGIGVGASSWGNENRRSYASRDPTRTPHPASAPAAASMVAEAPHWGKVAPVQGRSVFTCSTTPSRSTTATSMG